MAEHPMLSRSHEDYLKVIYNLEARFGHAMNAPLWGLHKGGLRCIR